MVDISVVPVLYFSACFALDSSCDGPLRQWVSTGCGYRGDAISLRGMVSSLLARIIDLPYGMVERLSVV